MVTAKEKVVGVRSFTLINRRKVRNFILDCAAKNRYHKFTGVKSSTLDRIEGELRSLCSKMVTGAPSKGKRL
jgi:hypothetical protein